MRFLTFTLTLSMLLSFQLLQPAEAATPVAVTGDFTGLVQLESGRSLYVECAGIGSPTVLLISGYRSRADVWTDDLFDPDAGFEPVFPALSQTTRVCTYDRPGTMSVLDGVQHPSRSDAVPTPRTAEEVVQEMRELRLLVADDEPIVLAAHSMGGLLARLYAATYPEDIAGLVLVDALSEFVQDEMPASEFAAYATYASEIPDILANYPEYETIDFIEASVAVRDATAATALPQVPTHHPLEGSAVRPAGGNPRVSLSTISNGPGWPRRTVWRRRCPVPCMRRFRTAATTSSSNVPTSLSVRSSWSSKRSEPASQ